jgi:general stress protein YciG
MRSKSGRGFASMDPDQQKIIASRGGRTAHERGRAHEFTSEEATAAGSKGGKVVSKDRAHMARIGRLGGQAKARRRKAGKAGKARKGRK